MRSSSKNLRMEPPSSPLEPTLPVRSVFAIKESPTMMLDTGFQARRMTIERPAVTAAVAIWQIPVKRVASSRIVVDF